MSAVDSVKGKVQRILTNSLGSVRIDKDGDFVVRNNSAVAFVRVSEGFGDDGVIVRITCPLIHGVTITPELCRWVAIDGQKYRIGGVSLDEQKPNVGWVFFRHHIIADDLDESELMGSLFAVLTTSDRLDNELHQKFGGELFGEE